MNNDVARSNAFSLYCINSNVPLAEVSLAAVAFIAGWDTGTEAAKTERDALLAKIEWQEDATRQVIISRGEYMDKLIVAETEITRLREALEELRKENLERHEGDW